MDLVAWMWLAKLSYPIFLLLAPGKYRSGRINYPCKMEHLVLQIFVEVGRLFRRVESTRL